MCGHCVAQQLAFLRHKRLICPFKTATCVDARRIITPTKALTGHKNKRSWAMVHSPPSQHNLSPLPGFFFAISIYDNLRGDHLREWQRLSPCVTFSGERRDAFETAAPLSDMAVPKALPGTARPVEEEEPATSPRPICKQNHWETFPTRHHLAATLTCPQISTNHRRVYL